MKASELLDTFGKDGETYEYAKMYQPPECYIEIDGDLIKCKIEEIRIHGTPDKGTDMIIKVARV